MHGVHGTNMQKTQLPARKLAHYLTLRVPYISDQESFLCAKASNVHDKWPSCQLHSCQLNCRCSDVAAALKLWIACITPDNANTLQYAIDVLLSAQDKAQKNRLAADQSKLSWSAVIHISEIKVRK